MKPGERRAIAAALAEVRAYFKPIDGEVWAPVPGAPRKAISTHHRVLSLAGPDGRGRHHGATILAQVGRLPRLPGPSALGEDPTIQRAVLAAFDRMPEQGDRALAVHGKPGPLLGLRWSSDHSAALALRCVEALAETSTWELARLTACRAPADFLRDQAYAEHLVPRGRTLIDRALKFDEPLRQWADRATSLIAEVVLEREARVEAAIARAVGW